MTNTAEITTTTDTPTTAVPDPRRISVLGPDEGPHFHFLDNLATIKSTAGADGTLSAVEFLAPRHFGPPLHQHRDEDELVVVLAGEVAFRTGDAETIAGPGTTVYLPRGVPHTFQVLSDTARMTSVTASVAGAPNFDRFVADLGEPTDEAAIPAPSPIDPNHVAQMCDRYGIDVLGPPPAPRAD